VSRSNLKGEGLEGRTSRILSRVIFYTLLSLIVLVAVPYGTVEPWWEALFESIVFVLGALWMIDGILTRRWFLPAHVVLAPIFLLAIYAFIQTWPLRPSGGATIAGFDVWHAISADPYGTRLSAFKLLALALTGALLIRYTSTNERLRVLIYTLIGVGIASAFFGILRQTTQRSDGFFLPFLLPNSGYGQFINRNHFAYLMEMRLVRREQMLIHLALA
jgi:hypothetical protein